MFLFLDAAKSHRKCLFLFSAFALLVSCGKSAAPVLNSDQFTEEFAEQLRHTPTVSKVNIAGERHLEVSTTQGSVDAFLDNAFGEYQQNPAAKAEVMARYVASIVETAHQVGKSQPVDLRHIVPVVKDRAWFDGARKIVMDAGGTQEKLPICDDLNPQLIIVYAEDLEKTVRFLSSNDLLEAHLERVNLRRLALDNLATLVKVQRFGQQGGYVIYAGGTYESSLLLKDSMWKPGEFEVQGELVVAIPARGKLYVTGSDNAVGLTWMKSMIDNAMKSGDHPITADMFVYRDGKFTRFVPPIH